MSSVLALGLFLAALSLSLSLSFPVWGACHRPNRLREDHDASWVGRVHVAGRGGSACLCVGRTAQEQMLCCLVVASAVWAVAVFSCLLVSSFLLVSIVIIIVIAKSKTVASLKRGHGLLTFASKF